MTNIKPDTEGTAFSSEMELLLLLSSMRLSAEQEGHARKLLQASIDWDLLFQLVIGNRVYPLIYINLIKLEGLDINTDFLSKLEREYRKNTFQVLQQTSELVKVMSLFDKNGIHAISIKGPILGLSLYGDVSMRTSKDLDILVDLSDIEKVSEILIATGYKSEDFIGLTTKQKALFIKTNHHISFHNSLGVLFELHWRFYVGTYDIPFEEIWRNSIQYSIAGSKIHILGNEENFIYLSVHGSVHAWKRIRWLCDARDMVAHCDLDWSMIQHRMEDLGISYILGQTLFLLDYLFHIEPGQSINLNKKDRIIAKRLAMMALPMIHDANKELEGLGSHPLAFPYKKYTFACHKGFLKKARFILIHFYPGNYEYQMLKINDRYFFLYYILRPFNKIYQLLHLVKRQDS